MSLVNRNYLRASRKKAGLSQAELAYLLSISRCHLSKVENRRHPIPLSLFVGYSVLLECDPVELCPDLASDIAKQTANRIGLLIEDLEPVITRVAARKRDALELIRLRCT